MVIKLHNYQKKAVEYLLHNPRCGLFLDMGMGKTLSVLYALNVLKYTVDLGKILIIAPYRVAAQVWDAEIKKWGFSFSYTKVMGTPERRESALRENVEIYITNVEQIVWISKYWDFDTIIIDEASMFKSTNTNRFKIMRRMKYKRLIALTGTPAPNMALELWPLVYMLDKGQRLENSVTKFRNMYGKPKCVINNQVVAWETAPGKAQDIYDKISDICISMKNVDPPEILLKDNWAELNAKERETYNRMLNTEILKEHEIVSLNAATRVNKLIQIANGRVYDVAGKTVILNTRKLDVLEDVLLSANGNNMLIFAMYKHDIAAIIERFKATQLIDFEHFEAWNAGKINIAIAHPAACGHGLNLQSGGHYITWYGLTWSLEQYLQANARLARQGQNETVIINRILTRDTIDEDLSSALDNKKVNLAGLLEHLRG